MRGPFGTLRERHVGFQGWIEEEWRLILVVLAGSVVGGATVVRFVHEPFYITEDSALFQHGGWYIGQGAMLYVDIWDLKPPLIYAVTTLLAFVARGDMAVLHVLSVFVSVVAVTAGVVFTGLTVHRVTDDGFAGIVAALSLFTLTSLYAFPWAGIRPKYFTFLCGTAALFYAVGDRYTTAGVAAALGAGFWQLGAGIAVLVVAIALDRGGPRAALRTVVGGIFVTVLTVLPFVVTGTVVPLIVEVVIAPLYGVERSTIPARLLAFVVEFGYGSVLLPVAAYGWWRGLRVNGHAYWWIAAGGVAYFLQVFLEFQGAIELVLVFVFLAMGVGILVADSPSPSRRSVVAAFVVLLVVSSGVWQAGSVAPGKAQMTALQSKYDVSSYAHLPPDPADAPSMEQIYWEKRTPDMCHYRLGHKQKYFAHATGEHLTKSTCGQWPFATDPFAWLTERG